jgi:hypothetical protein
MTTSTLTTNASITDARATAILDRRTYQIGRQRRSAVPCGVDHMTVMSLDCLAQQLIVDAPTPLASPQGVAPEDGSRPPDR